MSAWHDVAAWPHNHMGSAPCAVTLYEIAPEQGGAPDVRMETEEVESRILERVHAKVVVPGSTIEREREAHVVDDHHPLLAIECGR